jgi:amidase
VGLTSIHRIARDEVIWAFGPDLSPVLEIDPGETVTLETNDCFTGQIRSEADLVTEIDIERVNSATGPIAVRGAEPGDSLVVELLEVRPEERGFATLIPGMGQLIEQVEAPLTQVFRVDGDTIHMNERIRFPLRPMVGVIGCATGGETLTNGFAGEHGGNLDNHLHGPGATVYLPVRQPGGMLAIGDMHASMGDGEICFTGVEIAGEVTIRVGLLKGMQGTWPVTDLADRTSWRRSTAPPRKRRASWSTSGASRWRRPSSSSPSPATRTSARRAGRSRSPRSRAWRSRRSTRRLSPSTRDDALRAFYARGTAACRTATKVESSTSPLGGQRP